MTAKKKRRRKRRRYSRKRVIRQKKILAGILSILLLLVLFLSWRMVTGYEQERFEREARMVKDENDYARHNYDLSLFRKDGIFYSYEDENYTSLNGIDVSNNNKQIDWEKVKNTGVDFAMIRVGYRGYETGRINPDSEFEANMEGAAANGIETGVYFFSQATTLEEAAAEADYVIDALQPYTISLPVVFDMEEPAYTSRVRSLSREEKTRMAVMFLNRIRDAGYQPMVYNSTRLFEQFYDLSYLQEYDFWAAEYNSSIPHYEYAFSIWQYSSTGKVDGIETDTDLDIMLVPKN